jgi:hypothetical protein
MLNYAPDGMAVGSGEAWALAWEAQGLPDEGLLMSVVGAARAREAMPVVFHPERISGYCAG